MTEPDPVSLARRVRARVLAELEQAWEEASMQGLCGEGALEYAVDRVRHLDPAELLAAKARGDEPEP